MVPQVHVASYSPERRTNTKGVCLRAFVPTAVFTVVTCNNFFLLSRAGVTQMGKNDSDKHVKESNCTGSADRVHWCSHCLCQMHAGDHRAFENKIDERDNERFSLFTKVYTSPLFLLLLSLSSMVMSVGCLPVIYGLIRYVFVCVSSQIQDRWERATKTEKEREGNWMDK